VTGDVSRKTWGTTPVSLALRGHPRHVWMRHFSGQYQHQIAAAYVINVRAVNHVLKEKTHLGSKQVAEARFNKSA